VLSSYISTKKLVEYNKLKSEFVSHVAHDLRTPLMSISGALELLLTQEQDETKKNFLAIIDRNVQRMNSLVNTLLDFSRIEVGEFKLKKELIDIETTICDVIKNFNFLAETKKIKLNFVNFTKTKIETFADKERLIQIFSNLISNAIKFTPENGKITCAIENFNPKTKIVKISVSDTGIGIEKQYLEKVFNKFYQVNPVQPGTKNSGYGIGLSIVKSLVEAHNGKIEVKSQINKGTTFYIYLPVTKS
jgi:two-component system phosphate regulon sensor histidine kinase PhoR